MHIFFKYTYPISDAEFPDIIKAHGFLEAPARRRIQPTRARTNLPGIEVDVLLPSEVSWLTGRVTAMVGVG